MEEIKKNWEEKDLRYEEIVKNWETLDDKWEKNYAFEIGKEIYHYWIDESHRLNFYKNGVIAYVELHKKHWEEEISYTELTISQAVDFLNGKLKIEEVSPEECKDTLFLLNWDYVHTISQLYAHHQPFMEEVLSPLGVAIDGWAFCPVDLTLGEVTENGEIENKTYQETLKMLFGKPSKNRKSHFVGYILNDNTKILLNLKTKEYKRFMRDKYEKGHKDGVFRIDKM